MPRIPSAEEYKETRTSDFGLLASDDYIFEATGFDDTKVQPPSKYNATEEPRVWFFCSPKGFADDPDAELVDDEGNPVHPDKSVIFFYDPQRLGLVPQIARSRKFLAAILNVPVEEGIDFESYDDLLEKPFIGTVITKVGQNGKYNTIVDVRPLKKRTRVRATKQPTLAAKAEDVFGDMLASTSEDSGEY